MTIARRVEQRFPKPLPPISSTIGGLVNATEVLGVARSYRNLWKGHGGHVKASDVARLDSELQQSIRKLYEITAPIFRRLQLVRTGLTERTGRGLTYEIEKLSGSDPTFQRQKVELELDRSPESHTLAFWVNGARTMCGAVPFFRLGAPQRPQETSFYVFNRVENGGLRWISYQETLEQEIAAPDDELQSIIALGKGAKFEASNSP